MAVRKSGSRKPQKTRIIVVDDHPMVRERLAQLINRESDLVVCCEAEDAEQAMHHIVVHKPDMAIVDLSLKETDGLVLIKDIRSRMPGLPILVLSMHDETMYVERVLRAGARGYITKEEATQKVMTAIRRVLSGDIYVSDRMSGQVLEKIATGQINPEIRQVSVLSDRELDVFRRIGKGHSTKQIAESIKISHKTVESYRARIRAKLGIHSSTHLLQQAIQFVQSGEDS